MNKTRLEFSETSVIKRRDAEGAQHEMAAAEHGRRIGNESGLFEVPRVLSHDISNGVIEFERITGALQIRLGLSEGQLPEGVIKSLGAGLAAIHRSPPPENVREISLPWSISGHGVTPVFLHGDFQIENILYETQRSALFLVDWSAPDWLGGHGNLGPSCIDLGGFILSLFIRRPFQKDRIPKPGAHAHQFLNGYKEGGGEEAEIANLHRYFPALLDAFSAFYSNPRGRLSILASTASLAAAKRYVRNLC